MESHSMGLDKKHTNKLYVIHSKLGDPYNRNEESKGGERECWSGT